MADEAYRLGPPPAAQSYLLGDELIRIAKETGAEAVHPGYGFLSEREWFAKALEEAGIAFIGPKPHAIAAMGDKIESKKLAKKAGVSVVPGFVGEIEDTDHAAEIANRSEEHTSELQSLMLTSYAVFCLKKKKNTKE